MIKHKFVYAYNQKEAMEEFRYRYKEFVPIRAKYAGTKLSSRVYIVYYKNRRKK